jgi:hypothetical protein
MTPATSRVNISPQHPALSLDRPTTSRPDTLNNVPTRRAHRRVSARQPHQEPPHRQLTPRSAPHPAAARRTDVWNGGPGTSLEVRHRMRTLRGPPSCPSSPRRSRGPTASAQPTMHAGQPAVASTTNPPRYFSAPERLPQHALHRGLEDRQAGHPGHARAAGPAGAGRCATLRVHPDRQHAGHHRQPAAPAGRRPRACCASGCSGSRSSRPPRAAPSAARSGPAAGGGLGRPAQPGRRGPGHAHLPRYVLVRHRPHPGRPGRRHRQGARAAAILRLFAWHDGDLTGWKHQLSAAGPCRSRPTSTRSRSRPTAPSRRPSRWRRSSARASSARCRSG